MLHSTTTGALSGADDLYAALRDILESQGSISGVRVNSRMMVMGCEAISVHRGLRSVVHRCSAQADVVGKVFFLKVHIGERNSCLLMILSYFSTLYDKL